MKGSRLVALLVGLTITLMLGACGVSPSGVIEAGAPASGIVSPPALLPAPTSISLYFLHDGEPAPYTREFNGDVALRTILGMLFDGPIANEAETATTQLPHLAVGPEVRIGSDKTIIIHLGEGTPPLSHLAMRQLQCTVADVPRAEQSRSPVVTGNAATAKGSPTRGPSDAARVTIQVLGDGWKSTQAGGSCPRPLRP